MLATSLAASLISQLLSLSRLERFGEDFIHFLASAVGHLKNPALWDTGMWLTHVVLAGIDLDIAVSVVPLLLLMP
ncbi:hypothetical protein EXIGLDRAFT_721105 [Exidia glandulosa HHB12029]|uniref:Uncharacterized protein n=1 Tax=Exidia glandulosa HHB12029 TaxID=1314781 RepID=A0A165FXI6_EXIGL|nr:hypothetical protein EXIGLDRAFT_721105 [Exidia glandulosa HHB12029]